MAAEDRDDQYFGLADILRVFGRRWRWVVGSVIALTAVALLLSLQQESKYVARTRLLLRTVAHDAVLRSDPNAVVPAFAERQVANELQVIESADVRAAVEADYEGDLAVSPVDAEAVAVGSDGVVLSVTATDPDAAAELANLYAQNYLEFSRDQKFDAYEEANATLQARIDEIDQERAAVAAPLTEIEADLAANPGNAALLAQRASLQAQLASDLETLDNLRNAYIANQENLLLSQNLAPTAVAQVLAPASPPTDPESPKPLRDGIVGFMAGTGLGLALALAREFLDQSIRTSDDLERTLKGRYPILGVIPEVSSSEIAVLPGPQSHTAVAEAYRALRTSVRFAELDRPMKVIQITSASAGEGKTTTAANLARVLTQAGHRVAVACCDLRRPTIHTMLGVPVAPGLADVVLGERTLAEAISTTDDLTYVLPAGSSPPNPSELLGSSRAERVVAALAEEMDYTVIDTTPVLPVTDSIVVSRFADATLVVVSAGGTTRSQLDQALASLEQASAPVIGVVLNRAEVGDRNAYGYGYGLGYGYGYGKRAGSDRPSTGGVPATTSVS